NRCQPATSSFGDEDLGDGGPGSSREQDPPSHQLRVDMRAARRVHVGQESVRCLAAHDQHRTAQPSVLLDDPGLRLPVEPGEHPSQPALVWQHLLPALGDLAPPELEEKGQILGPTRPHAVTRVTTSCVSGISRRIISSSSLSMRCACSRLISPATSATTWAWMRLSRSLSSTSRQRRTSGCDSTTAQMRAASWTLRAVTSWPGTTSGSIGSRWMSMRVTSGSSARIERSRDRLVREALSSVPLPG